MLVTCRCGKEFTDGLKLAKHRLKCAIFQKQKYYTKASVEQIDRLLQEQTRKKHGKKGLKSEKP